MTRTVRVGSYATQNDLIQPITAQRERAPRNAALRDGRTEWSYADLLDRVGRIAAALEALGIGPGDICAMPAERSADTIALLLAIVACGAAYLPLARDQPDARLASMCADARPQLAIVDGALHARLPAGIAWIDCAAVDAPRCVVAAQPSGALAYVLFTSGSTGQPKGVAMQTAAVAALVDWHRAHPRLGAAARTLQFAPLTFDVSFQEIFSTLATGGTLILADETDRRDPWRLLDLIARERIERMFVPFIALQAIAEAATTAARSTAAPRDIVTAGERLRITPAIRAFFAARPGCVLHNHYGPTETHVVTTHELGGDPALWPDLPPIGEPLPHVHVRFDGADADATELLLGGACLAAGYIGRPGLTAERFVVIDGERWYRSGDHVARLASGELDYRGRLDDQLKVAGRRIEPAEIEAVLGRHALVGAAAVVAQRHGTSARLVAHIVPRENALDPAQVRVELGKHCAALLPEYMVPASFVLHAALPTTPSGKIDRRALAQDAARGELAWDATAPLDRRLAELWRQLLDVDEVPAGANVFELGARSLTVVEALTELRRRGHVLSVADIYENPSAAAQAALLGAPRGNDAAADDRGARTRDALAGFGRPHAAA